VRATDWAWVDEWIDTRWGNREGGTHAAYLGRWRRLQQWLLASDIKSPVALTREACQRYPQWRLDHGGGRNTAIEEMKLLGRIMKEAVARKMVTENPARALGLERDHPEEGRAYTQPIDEPLLEPLREIVEHRQASGKKTLCDIPLIVRRNGSLKPPTKGKGEKRCLACRSVSIYWSQQ
jgi:hypothetical protein